MAQRARRSRAALGRGVGNADRNPGTTGQHAVGGEDRQWVLRARVSRQPVAVALVDAKAVCKFFWGRRDGTR